jgi:hypothetical protein
MGTNMTTSWTAGRVAADGGRLTGRVTTVADGQPAETLIRADSEAHDPNVHSTFDSD